MLLKVFGVGIDTKHESRWRESMISNSFEACPLWLLFKCHKGWTSSKGTPPPTRPVVGGNSGMNTHLSEVLSWALEPLADSIAKKSSEVISNEDMRSKFDKCNKKFSKWVPQKPIQGSITNIKVVSEKEKEVPGLCDCKECEDEGNNQNVQEGRKVSIKTENCQNENVPKGRKDNSIRGWLMRQKCQEFMERRKKAHTRKHDLK